jgi:hypothetical protein
MPKSTMRMGRVRRSIPLEKLSQLRILERLRDAHGLARRGIGAHATRIRELLDDVRVRLDAMDVVARVTSGVGKEAGASRAAEPTGGGAPAGGGTMLRCVMRSELGRPVSEFRLLPFGEVDVERALAGGSFTFTRAHAEAAVRWFNELQRKLAIDYEHQSVTTPGRPDGLRPAAGWIGGLEIRDDGLWATRVEWTPKARQLLEAGEYRYFSPVIYWADEDYRELVGLGPVALTNDPAMHGVPALATTRGPVAPPADRPAGVGDADRGSQPPSRRWRNCRRSFCCRARNRAQRGRRWLRCDSNLRRRRPTRLSSAACGWARFSTARAWTGGRTICATPRRPSSGWHGRPSCARRGGFSRASV